MARRSSKFKEQLQFIDDTEEAIWNINPSDNIYSYFMFVTPTESAKENAVITWDTSMGWILATLNFFMQGLLLYTVYNEVVVANQEWQASIIKPEESISFLGGEKPAECNMGGSMCFMDGGNYSCAPPTVQLTGRWNELDTNGDGIWTRKEVEEARADLQCKYVVNPVEVFDVFVNFLKTREKILWLHDDVKSGKAIHKAYFNFAAGDIITCGYRNVDMCSNVLKRGFYHAPLKHKTAPRVGTTIDSALKYCYELLKPGGTCEKFLPSTYSVWKIASNDQCGSPSYEKFVYKNPGNGVIKSLLEVDYSSRKKYALSRTMIFRIYKTIVIGMWLLAMLMELKDIIIIATWVAKFPNAEDFDGGEGAVDEEEAEDGEKMYTILGITKLHRWSMGLVTFLRFVLVSVLTYAGVSFLLKQTSYINLLMDAVTLVFIVEIANLIYTQALRPQIREQCESLQPMVVQKFSCYGILDFFNTRPGLTDIVWFIGVVAAATILIYWYSVTTVENLYDALQCACLGLGDKCMETHKFSYDFWYEYWKETVPAVFDEVKVLKETSLQLIDLTSSNATLVLSHLKTNARSFLSEDMTHGDYMRLATHMTH